GEVDGSHEARVYGRALGARGAASAPWRAREGSVPRRGAVPGRRERPEPEVTPHLGQQLLPVLERAAGGTGTGGEIPRLLDAGRLQLLVVQGDRPVDRADRQAALPGAAGHFRGPLALQGLRVELPLPGDHHVGL